MPLPIAIFSFCALSAVSLGAGLYLLRFQRHFTEMLGMMLGMTLGMMTGLAAGTWLGLAADMFVSNTASVLLGLALGVGFGRAGGWMGMLDGGMGGVMGGMMGAMLGVMVRLSPLAIWSTAGLMTLVYALSLAGLVQLVRTRCHPPLPIDPVCGMEVDPKAAPLTTVYRAERIYFCAPACQRAFERHPERYRAGSGEPAAAAPAATLPRP